MKNFSFRIFAVGMLAALFAASAFAQANVIYNSIPSPMPGNFPSQPFQAQQASEVGDRLQFAAGGRNLVTVSQTMSSWACQNGTANTLCTTTPGATFAHPITLKIYNVGAGDAVGSLIGSVTQIFAIPYRPSTNPVCGDGRWSTDGTAANCFNGYATNITFNLGGLVVPNQVIYGIAYNTSGYGYNPMGYNNTCNGTVEGCPYDSLNVALGGTASVGINPAPSDAYFNTITPGWYCDGGASGVGMFRLDAGCWTGVKSVVKFVGTTVPTNANQCKNGGWQTVTRADGSTFKNQGDCIQYVNNGH